MDEHQYISGQSSEHTQVSASERSLQAKIVRLENQLQGYKSQIDILDHQRQKLEERTLSMESALIKTKKDLLEAKREVLDKDLTEMKLSEKLNAMTIQAEKYKRLFMAESTKNRCGIEKLEKLISNVKARMAPVATLNQFEDFKELVTVIQEGFQTQILMVLEKLHEAENKPSPKPGFQLNQGKKTNGKPLFTLGRPSSGPCAGFTFETVKLPFDTKLPFGSAAEGEDGGKSIFTFSASVKQTPKSSSGTAFQISENIAQVKPAFIFGSLDQKPKSSSGAALLGNEKAAETKPAFIFGSLDEKPKSNSGAALLGNEKAAETKPAFNFSSLDEKPKSNSGAALLGNEKAAETKPAFTFSSLEKPKSNSGTALLGNEKAAETKPAFIFGSLDQKPKSSSGAALLGNEKAAETKPAFTFSSLEKPKSNSGAALLGNEKAAETKPAFTFSSLDEKPKSSSGAALLGNEKAAETKPAFTFSSLDEKPKSSSGAALLGNEKAAETKPAFIFGSLDQKPKSSSGAALLGNEKAAETKPVFILCSQDKKTEEKPLFALGSVATSSGTGFTFGLTVPSSGTEFSFGSAGTSEGAAKPCFTFGSSNQKPNTSSGAALTFDSLKQGRNATRELQAEEHKKDDSRSDKQTLKDVEQLGDKEDTIAATFGSVATRHSGKDLLETFKAEEGSWECDICLVRNSNDKVECVACSSPKSGVELSLDKKTQGKSLSAFGSGAMSSGTGFTFGSGATSSGTGIIFGSTVPSSGTGVSFRSGSTAHAEEVKEDLLAKFKAEEGSWECSICMVRNGSDKLECAACASQKPGVK